MTMPVQETAVRAEERKSSLWRTLARVLVTLIIWLALAIVAAAIVAIVPNVKPCLDSGLKGCRAAIAGALTPGSQGQAPTPAHDPAYSAGPGSGGRSTAPAS